MKVKVEVAEIRKFFNDLYDWYFVLAFVITELEPNIEIKDIWSVSMGEERRKKEKNTKVLKKKI